MNARAWLLATLVLGACEQPAMPPPSRPWTMFDLQQAFDAETPVLEGVEGFPKGFPYDTFVEGRQPLIPVNRAFTEGGYSPYITTNLWANVPEVWVQPMYILVTGWNELKQEWTKAGAPWIYTVGPKSRFHSPFWRVYWVLAPNAGAGDYTSSDQILRDKLPLIEGPGRLVTLVPDETVIGPLPPGPSIPGLELPEVRRQKDYLDGRRVSAIDFGENRFEWNEYLEVIEQPLFVLVTCGAPGDCRPSKTPNIGGTGPLFQRRPAIAPGGRPRFGSVWRLHFVTLPPGDEKGVFIPPSVDDATRDLLVSKLIGVQAPRLGYLPAPVDLPAVNRHYMQVALNASTCFKTPEEFAKCQWLDSQKAVEELLPQAIQRSGVTCPFVGYDGMDVADTPPKPVMP
jgi:hypothetical protein